MTFAFAATSTEIVNDPPALASSSCAAVINLCPVVFYLSVDESRLHSDNQWGKHQEHWSTKGVLVRLLLVLT